MIDDYNEVVKIALEGFPELEGRLQETFGHYYDLKKENPGGYPIFEDVIQKVVLELLEKDENNSLLNRLFAFFEEMSGSSNRGITDLLGIAILEPLVSRPERLTRAWQYMGSKTRQLTRESAWATGDQENLPPTGEAGSYNGH